MKKFTLPAITGILFLLAAAPAPAQKTQTRQMGIGTSLTPQRCGTMEELYRQIRQDPSIIEKWKKEGERLYNQSLQQRTGENARTTAGPIIIPVVFHLVGTSTILNTIPDRDCYEQVEILNQDYSGTKAGNYAGLYPAAIASRLGVVDVKFVMARRDPSNALSTGIERRVTAQTFTAGTVNNLKTFAGGGLDAWDPTKFLNIWAGTFTDGLLGIATFPFSAGPQGVCTDLYALGANPCRTYYPTYAEGSTLSHEVGHYFYLWHAWSDDGGVCGDQDFRIQAGWPLDGAALTDDTPDEAGGNATLFGNISGAYADGCASNPPGMMYQNFMNYYDDRGLFMFSVGQKARIDSCISKYRSGLLTTNGGTPPSAVADAYLISVTPWGKCDTRQVIINNTPLKARVRNYGTSTLNSVKLTVVFDGGAPTTTTFPLTLGVGNDTTLNLGNLSGAAGGHTVQVYTTLPNGGADDFTNNDTLNSLVYINTAAVTLPLNESFSGAFPPANWVVYNPHGDITWATNATAGFTAAGSVFMNNYNDANSGTLDELVLPPIDPGTNVSMQLSFEVSHAQYDNNTFNWDGLEVYVSGDGGANYKLAYKKVSYELRTVPGVNGSSFNPGTNPAQWRLETVDLTPYLIFGQKMLIKFRNVTAFGNNTYLDDISVIPILAPQARDMGVTVINRPNDFECSAFAPQVVVKNLGTQTVNTYSVRYSLDGGAPVNVDVSTPVPAGATATVTFSSINPAPGNHTVKAWTTNIVGASGSGDQNPFNDTISKAFTVKTIVSQPFFEGFEGATFVPAGWTLNNPDAGVTWARRTTGVAAGGTAMTWLNFYAYSSRGQFDEMITPPVDATGLGTKLLTFDRAYRDYGDNPAASNYTDSLEVLVSTDCGVTYTSVWKKWGAVNGDPNGLATIPSAGFSQYTQPASVAEWQTASINITALAAVSGYVQAKFKGTTMFGNNLFVDNINIRRQVDRDLGVSLISRPNPFECAPFAPQVTVKNYGVEAVTSFRVEYNIDGGAFTGSNFTVTIAPNATTVVTLPITGALTPGNHTIIARTADPVVSASGTGEQNVFNDAATKTFNVRTLILPPVVEGFEAATFPSPGWSVLNPDGDVFTWVRVQPGYNSPNSAFIDDYDNFTTGMFDYVLSPALKTTGTGVSPATADSVIVTFDLAYQYYPGLYDSLAIIASTDCGNTFPVTAPNLMFASGGVVLAGPAGGSTAPFLNPSPNQWQHLRTATGGASLVNGHVMISFRNRSGIGNNMFLDNINIESVFKRDLQLVSIDRPRAAECSGSFTASATVKNKGTETITGFSIAYKLDNGAAQTTVVTGINLARNATMSVNLTPAIATTLGLHNIQVYSFSPITTSGTGDMLTTNDTLSKQFGVTGTVPAPLTEGFEGTVFPPANWILTNPDGNITWAKGPAGKGSPTSAYVNNWNYNAFNRVDELWTPNITYTGVDSIRLTFDVAAATLTYPGTTGVNIDTLEVLATRDCGNTFTTIYKKWGYELQTINDPNYPQTSEFIPASDFLWRNEGIDLTAFIPNGPLQIVFRNTTNSENNIFVDNVNLSTKTLPAKLKDQGYLLLPNPFTSQFSIWHLQTPTNLRYVTVYNSAGQLVWTQQYNGDATKLITVDLTGKAGGVYVVTLGYTDRNQNVSVRVVKGGD